MKQLVLSFVLLLSLQNISAQKIAFTYPGDDSLQIQETISTLAGKIIPLYENSDRRDYWYEMSFLQTANQNYTGALASFDNLYKALNGQIPQSALATINYGMKTFLQARISGEQTHADFFTAYKKLMDNEEKKLTEVTRVSASSSLNRKPEAVYAAFKETLNAQQSLDSIELPNAVVLCFQYADYIVASNIYPIAHPMVAKWDDEYFINDSTNITLPNGAILSAAIAGKKNAAPRPAVLVYNIYSGPGDISQAKLFAVQGFTGIVVNTRGKKRSPQEVMPYVHDAEDAYGIIDWISKQPWCNGSVGMIGGSYLGFSQWASVKRLHPALKTIVPQVSVGPGIDFPQFSGIFAPYNLRWIQFVSNQKNTDPLFYDTERREALYRKYYTSGIAFNKLDSLDGKENKIFQKWLRHPDYDEFWKQMIPDAEGFSKLNIPVLTTTGFYDDDQRGAFYYYLHHLKYNPNAQHYLVIGPYDHGGGQNFAAPVYQGYKIDAAAQVSMRKLGVEWLKHILLGEPMPELIANKINVQVPGTNQWRSAASLKELNNDTLLLYLSAGENRGFQKLSVTKPAKEIFIPYQINMADRSDSLTVSTNDDNMFYSGYNIYDTTLQGNNLINFISEPLPQNTEVNGSFISHLFASVNKKDMDLQIFLIAQLPDGHYQFLSNALFRASFVKGNGKRSLLTPGKKEEIYYDNSFYTSMYLPKGSRIILQLGVLKDPKYQINYGTGKDVSTETIYDAGEPMKIKWFGESYIGIPVWKYKG